MNGGPINKRRALAAGVIFFGSFGILKLMQDARFLRKDLHKLSEVQVTERDLAKVQAKFKLTDEEMKQILTTQKKYRAETVNMIETDPNFQHKRAE